MCFLYFLFFVTIFMFLEWNKQQILNSTETSTMGHGLRWFFAVLQDVSELPSMMNGVARLEMTLFVRIFSCQITAPIWHFSKTIFQEKKQRKRNLSSEHRNKIWKHFTSRSKHRSTCLPLESLSFTTHFKIVFSVVLHHFCFSTHVLTASNLIF